MQPQGRIKKIMGFQHKTDYHLHNDNKKVGNWWEDYDTVISRRNLKQILKPEIEDEIWQMYEDQRLWWEAFFND